MKNELCPSACPHTEYCVFPEMYNKQASRLDELQSEGRLSPDSTAPKMKARFQQDIRDIKGCNFGKKV
jgi:hypothetical protein